jgi:hypothetical protein
MHIAALDAGIGEVCVRKLTMDAVVMTGLDRGYGLLIGCVCAGDECVENREGKGIRRNSEHGNRPVSNQPGFTEQGMCRR